MPAPITVDDMLNEVRDQIDESNSEDVSDSDILQSLNRAQRKVVSILARKFPDLFLQPVSVTTTGNVGEYDVPKNAYGRRINQITVTRSSFEAELTRIPYTRLAKYRTGASVSLPSVYALVGRQYYLRPVPTAACSLTLWITAKPETMVVSQGRITSVNVASNYVLLDSLGADLTTDISNLAAFVNIVDAQTGEIKVSLQISSINTTTKKVTFKSSGLSLSTIYNRTIDTAIDSDVETNDYVCLVQGTCVPDVPDACTDYCIQFAVTELRRRFGLDVQGELIALKEQAEEIERQWVGRQQAARITNNSRAWSR